MARLSAAAFESKYRSFLDLRKQWTDLIDELALYHSSNVFGQTIRSVVVTDDKQLLSDANNILKQWERFARYADKYREEGVSNLSQLDYSPIPFIVSNCVQATLNEGSAQVIVNLTKEKIISLIERKIRACKRNGTDEPRRILKLNLDLERFKEFSDGTSFRRRRTGYSDTLLITRDLNDKEITYRVGTWGAIVDSSSLKKDFKRMEGKTKTTSIYDMCQAIPCSLWDTGALYLTEDVNKAKEQRGNELHPSTAYMRRKEKRLSAQYASDTDN